MSWFDDLFGVRTAQPTPGASNYDLMFGPPTPGEMGRSVGAMAGRMAGDVSRGPLAYPSASDATLARDVQAGYDTPWHALLSGERSRQFPESQAIGGIKGAKREMPRVEAGEGDPHLAELLTRAHLATRRSALASLGFDPSKVTFDTKIGPDVNTYGFTDPDTGLVYSNPAAVSNVVHESIHRAVLRMQNDPDVPKEWKKFLETKYQSGDGEEMLVRELMRRTMGDPEQETGGSQRGQAYHVFKNPKNFAGGSGDKMIDDMERWAAEQIRRDRPYGGPR
jgi:hypothetical protein